MSSTRSEVAGTATTDRAGDATAGALAGLLSVIIMTRDEEANLPRTLPTLRALGAEVFIVDSGSTDRTVEIAEEAGAVVVHHPWINYARQLNWSIDQLPLTAPWVMRLDADERLTPELAVELAAKLPALPDEVVGLELKRQVWFWGRWIRHGGFYPMWVLRLWRRGRARCEDRWMDEHMIVDGGRIERLEHDIIDEDHKGLGFWIDKHNRYADRELRDVIEGYMEGTAGVLTGQASRRRVGKERLYYRLPPFLRAFLFWFIRYFARLGFLDGRPGLVYHFLQAFWYRFLVDAKLVEHDLRRGAAGPNGLLPRRPDAPAGASGRDLPTSQNAAGVRS